MTKESSRRLLIPGGVGCRHYCTVARVAAGSRSSTVLDKQDDAHSKSKATTHNFSLQERRIRGMHSIRVKEDENPKLDRVNRSPPHWTADIA